MQDDQDRKPKDPTPEQIRAMCEEIRRSWPAWRLARHDERIDYELQVVIVDDLET
jgi:hypothetical protein